MISLDLVRYDSHVDQIGGLHIDLEMREWVWVVTLSIVRGSSRNLGRQKVVLEHRDSIVVFMFAVWHEEK